MQCILKAVDSTHQSALKFTSNFMSDGSVGRTIRAASLWNPSIKAHFFWPKAPAILPSASEVEKERSIFTVASSISLQKQHTAWPLWQPMLGAFLVDFGLGETPSGWDHGLDSAAFLEAYSSLRHAILKKPLGPAGCGGAHAISIVASIE